MRSGTQSQSMSSLENKILGVEKKGPASMIITDARQINPRNDGLQILLACNVQINFFELLLEDYCKKMFILLQKDRHMI